VSEIGRVVVFTTQFVHVCAANSFWDFASLKAESDFLSEWDEKYLRSVRFIVMSEQSEQSEQREQSEQLVAAQTIPPVRLTELMNTFATHGAYVNCERISKLTPDEARYCSSLVKQKRCCEEDTTTTITTTAGNDGRSPCRLGVLVVSVGFLPTDVSNPFVLLFSQRDATSVANALVVRDLLQRGAHRLRREPEQSVLLAWLQLRQLTSMNTPTAQQDAWTLLQQRGVLSAPVAPLSQQQQQRLALWTQSLHETERAREFHAAAVSLWLVHYGVKTDPKWLVSIKTTEETTTTISSTATTAMIATPAVVLVPHFRCQQRLHLFSRRTSEPLRTLTHTHTRHI